MVVAVCINIAYIPIFYLFQHQNTQVKDGDLLNNWTKISILGYFRRKIIKLPYNYHLNSIKYLKFWSILFIEYLTNL